MANTKSVLVGTVLYGYCGGAFGKDWSDGPRRVEALGVDWVVARMLSEDSEPEFARVAPEELEKFTVKPEEDSDKESPQPPRNPRDRY